MKRFIGVLSFLSLSAQSLAAPSCESAVIKSVTEKIAGEMIQVNNIAFRNPDGIINETALQQLFGGDPQVIIGIDGWGGYIIAGDLRIGFTKDRSESRSRTIYTYNVALKMTMPQTITETTYYYTHTSHDAYAGPGYFVRLVNFNPQEVADIASKLRAALNTKEVTNWDYALGYALYQLYNTAGIQLNCAQKGCENNYTFLKKIITKGLVHHDGRSVEIEHYVLNQPSLAKFFKSHRNRHFLSVAGWTTLWATLGLTAAGTVGATGYLIWLFFQL